MTRVLRRGALVVALVVGSSSCGEPSPLLRADDSGTLACGSHPGAAFTPAELTAPGGAENDRDEPALALRASLDSDGFEDLPSTGYRPLSRTDDRVLFVTDAVGEWGPYLSLEVEREGGVWGFANFGRCDVRRLRSGVAATTWALRSPVAVDASTFTALVEATGCTSGRSPEGRILAPIVTESARTVKIAFFLSPLEGNQTCPGSPPAPYDVTLREPLGARVLYDDGPYPPKRAEVTQ